MEGRDSGGILSRLGPPPGISDMGRDRGRDWDRNRDRNRDWDRDRDRDWDRDRDRDWDRDRDRHQVRDLIGDSDRYRDRDGDLVLGRMDPFLCTLSKERVDRRDGERRSIALKDWERGLGDRHREYDLGRMDPFLPKENGDDTRSHRDRVGRSPTQTRPRSRSRSRDRRETNCLPDLRAAQASRQIQMEPSGLGKSPAAAVTADNRPTKPAQGPASKIDFKRWLPGMVMVTVDESCAALDLVLEAAVDENGMVLVSKSYPERTTMTVQQDKLRPADIARNDNVHVFGFDPNRSGKGVCMSILKEGKELIIKLNVGGKDRGNLFKTNIVAKVR